MRQANFPYVGRARLHTPNVPKKLRLQLGEFLKRERGDTPYAKFSRRVGISKSTLHRLELGEQNVTLDMVEQVLAKLKVRLSDVFPQT